MKKKRVGIDFHAVDGKFQGSRTHILELFSQVIEVSPDLDFYLFVDDTDGLGKLNAAFSRENVHLIRMPAASPFKRLLRQLPQLAKQYSLDVLHTQYILPPLMPCSGMVTIHDVLFETHPQFFEAFFRFRSRMMMRWSAKRAAHVFTVSEYSKTELSRLYGVESEDVTVIHNAVDFGRFCPGVEGADVVKARGLVSNQYILSVGRLEPRKNHATLIKAYASLKFDDLPLVIVGQRDFRYGEIFSLIKSCGIEDRVVILEDVSDDELPVLYRHASLFVYPAFAEGFGMPPLEAMASGVPTISSDTTAIPEVVGEAGLLVSPFEVPELAASMRKVLIDQVLSEKMRRAGLERAKKFSWRASAERVRAQYMKHFNDVGGAENEFLA